VITMQTPVAFVMSQNAVSRELYSARPDAPTVPHVERGPRARGMRLVVAGVLTRAARAITPVEPCGTVATSGRLS
jgi:hypothetical protein